MAKSPWRVIIITIYSTETCSYCVLVKQLCEKLGKQYQVIDITYEPEMARRLQEKSGYVTVPITTDGETYIAGYQPDKLIPFIRESE